MTPNHARASLHLLRARARRQLFEERFATLAWGGDLKPGEGAAVEGGAVEGAGAGAFSAQEVCVVFLEEGFRAPGGWGGAGLGRVAWRRVCGAKSGQVVSYHRVLFSGKTNASPAP